MSIISWIISLFEGKAPEHELNLNHNDYDPHSEYIIWYKKELRKKLGKKKIPYKEYSKQCSAMKAGFKNKTLLDVPVEKFNDQTLVNSCIAQREPNTKVFPDGIVNCTLKDWNTINCVIPAGITLDGGVHHQVMSQNDMEYWIVDNALKPVSPLSPKMYDKYGLSKDPKDLPPTPLAEDIIVTAEKEKAEQDRKAYILDVVNDPQKFQETLDDDTLI